MAAAAGNVHAQQPRDVSATDTWAGITGDVRVSPTVNVTVTSEMRRSDGLRVPRQLFLLAGLTAHVGHGVRVGGGYSRWHTSPNEEFGPPSPTDEHRLWQQLTGTHAVRGAAFAHRLRHEQRWIAPEPANAVPRDWTYSARVRHQLRVVAPLDGRSAAATRVYAMPNVELFVRTTKRAGVFVDQTRLGAALGVGVAPMLNLEAGYLRQAFVHGGSSLEIHHVVQVTARLLAARRPGG